MYALESLIVLLLVLVFGYLSASALISILAMVRSGAPEDNFFSPGRRIDSVIQYVFFHKRVLDDKSYGIMHMFYLYGFLILGIGHLELVLHGLTKFLRHFEIKPFLYENFLPPFLIKPFLLSQDLMAFFVVVVVVIALFRRIVMPKKRLLPRSKDAETILWLIGALYVSFFIYVPSETFIKYQAGEGPLGFQWYAPISSLIAQGFNQASALGVASLNQLGFWSHLGIFLGFAAYIPRSKHLHLIAAGPNIYFRHFDAVAKPQPIDFEKSETFGVERVDNLSWKSLLDTFACTECGRCDAVCPAALTGKSLHPKKVLHDIKLNLRYKNWASIKPYKTLLGDAIAGKEEELKGSVLPTPLINREPQEAPTNSDITRRAYDIHGQVHLDDIWACTTCAACVDVCPVLIDSVPISLMDMRRHLVLMEAQDYPKELNSAMRGMEVQGNPWGVGQDKRTEWAASLDVKTMAERNEEVEYLFWVGCAGATDDRAKKIQQALVRVLKSAKVDFAILGCEEKCTGDPARRMGNEYLFDSLAKENIATLSKYKFKKIFTSCPHCFNSLKNEYTDFGTNYTVQHHSELIFELMKDGRIPLAVKESFESEVTFHDPCYLGRYNDGYEAPREVLAAAVGKKPVEMAMSKRNSMCCGAGGGRMFMEEHIGKRINHERCDQALKTNAKTIATGCPFCMTMMNDGIKDKGLEESIQVKDIAEIVSERL